ncbi:MAG: hypothetical protein ACYTXY_54455, partial [Nostoc sp.]
LNPNNQVRTKNMQSTLFTELTTIEETKLSGGKKTKNVVKDATIGQGGNALGGNSIFGSGGNGSGGNGIVYDYSKNVYFIFGR